MFKYVYNWQIALSIVVFSGLQISLFARPVNADVTIAAAGKSTFSIVVPKDAPTSVINAAEELQKDIEIATNTKLSIKKDAGKLSGAFLSLGATEQAKNAGFSSKEMPADSYRIVTKDGNLYIFGYDTPDGGWTEKNGTSEGTANGVYTFLEDYLDVRWLMPGDIGRDIPHKSTFTLPDIDENKTPPFSMRKITHIHDYANVTQLENIDKWEAHQRLGQSTNWYYMHNWWKALNIGFGGERTTDVETKAIKKAYDEHPEWFAMDENGKRPRPTSNKDKLETTNPELVQWFADQAIKQFESDERPSAFSISPSDGSAERFWSKSPESQKLLEPVPDWDPIGKNSYENSTSSLVLKWYHDVAQIVAKKYPDRTLTGFLYAAYLYPPQKVDMKLPPNFVPFIAPRSNYGYTLYRDDTKKYFSTLMDAWADIVTGEWFYYDLPNQFLRHSSGLGSANFPGSTGIITPASPEILNVIFPQLVKSHINGVNIYGVSSWSNAALANYLLAKMSWDPSLDAYELQQEWLNRAYGKGAGVVMTEFYANLDEWYKDYLNQREKPIRYTVPAAIFADLYKVHYPEMEEVFLRAKAQPMTDVQKKRLQLIEDNLIVLQWRMRQSSVFPTDFESALQRDDAYINKLISESDGGAFANFPGIANKNSKRYEGEKTPRPFKWKVQLEDKLPTDKGKTPAWDSGQFLIYAAQNGDIEISTVTVSHGLYFAAYELKNQKGEIIQTGIFDREKPIIIPAKSGDIYTLNIPVRKPVNFDLQVKNAVVAQGNLRGKTLTLSGKKAPVYLFHIAGEDAVGIVDAAGGAKIKKPFGRQIGAGYAKARFSKILANQTLNEGWLFSPDPQDDGEQRGVLKADFDDSSWTPISPYSVWQEQGFPDYHGPAWYRVKFDVADFDKIKKARFFIGAIDGDAEVYLNGEKIREHKLGPNYEGWNKYFSANALPSLKSGENILAIKVISKSDDTASGIFKGVTLITGEN